MAPEAVKLTPGAPEGGVTVTVGVVLTVTIPTEEMLDKEEFVQVVLHQ